MIARDSAPEAEMQVSVLARAANKYIVFAAASQCLEAYFLGHLPTRSQASRVRMIDLRSLGGLRGRVSQVVGIAMRPSRSWRPTRAASGLLERKSVPLNQSRCSAPTAISIDDKHLGISGLYR